MKYGKKESPRGEFIAKRACRNVCMDGDLIIK